MLDTPGLNLIPAEKMESQALTQISHIRDTDSN